MNALLYTNNHALLYEALRTANASDYNNKFTMHCLWLDALGMHETSYILKISHPDYVSIMTMLKQSKKKFP